MHGYSRQDTDGLTGVGYTRGGSAIRVTGRMRGAEKVVAHEQGREALLGALCRTSGHMGPSGASASARFQGLAGEDVVGDVVVGGALGVHHEDFHLFPVLGEHHPGLVTVGSVEGVVDQNDT